MITSISNPQVKNLVRLRQKSSERRAQGVFLAEGERMFDETPHELLTKVYVSETYYNKNERELGRVQAPLEVLSDALFSAVSDTMAPQGVLCVVKQRRDTLEELLEQEKPLFLLLEDIQDPGNLGTMVRTAEAAGVTAVIMSKGTVDLYNPKTVRSTMGAIYRVPVLVSEDFAGLIMQLKSKGIAVYAACLAESVDYDVPSYVQGTAFLVGNEGNGLRDATAAEATAAVKIPMQGKAESLNAGVAASILLYEAYRQRRGQT